jgi:hypothetical protein
VATIISRFSARGNARIDSARFWAVVPTGFNTIRCHLAEARLIRLVPAIFLDSHTGDFRRRGGGTGR